MKSIFLETHYTGKLELPQKVIAELPKKLVLALPVQFLGFLDKLKEQLEKAGKEVQLFKGLHDKYPGQILGCDVFKFSFANKSDAFLYIGDGNFHPTALLYENKKPVFCYNPFTSQMRTLTSDYLEKVHKKKQALLAKFLQEQNIGILVTTKIGQYSGRKAEELREELEKAEKSVFVFIADEVNFSQLENFNFIGVWINTACPRIVEDFSALNLLDLKQVGF